MLLTILACVVCLIGYVGFKSIQDATARNSRRGDWAIFVVRWFDGSHWTGHNQTNAGFKRKGTGKALTQTGYARPFYYLPRWKRILIRWAETFSPLLAGVLWLRWPWETESGLATIAFLGVAGLGWRIVKRVKYHPHHRDALKLLHERLGPLADIPPGASPDSWIEVSKDHSEATLTLPDSYRDNDAAQANFAKRAAEALGMEEPEIFWKLHRKDGNDPELKLVNSPAPPPYVSLGDVIGSIKNGTPDVFTFGLGRKSLPVDISLDTDSPNIGASMGAGAGKSTMARFLAAQALYKGCIVVFIDTKRVSHVWARGLPNVIYADTPELVHEVLLWLDEELERRNEVAVFGAIAERNGAAPVNVGPRIFIVAEELNLTANKLRTYWVRDLEGKGKSPAEVALQNLAFAGRQVRMNYLVIAQMLTARVLGGTSGGGEARENIGIRLLSRYSKKNWEMLVPEMNMPPVSTVKGRTQVAALGKLRVVQVADISEDEATQLALSGVVAPLPSTLPALLKSSLPRVSKLPLNTVNPQVMPVSDTSTDTNKDIGVLLLSLREFVDAKVLKGATLAALRMARQRDSNFPKPRALRDKTHVYDKAEMVTYWRNRGRRR